MATHAFEFWSDEREIFEKQIRAALEVKP